MFLLTRLHITPTFSEVGAPSGVRKLGLLPSLDDNISHVFCVAQNSDVQKRANYYITMLSAVPG